MSRSDRAKQFMPFDALKGLKQALREKEIEHERKAQVEFSEEESKRISDTLSEIRNDSEISLTYYDNGYNHIVSGSAKLKRNDGIIQVNGQNIRIESIVSIKIN